MPAGTLTVYVEFPELDLASANRAAAQLHDDIKDTAKDLVHIDRTRPNSETQDFGSTLVIVLGTPAVVILARAIYNYCAKWGDRVVIRTANGEVIVTGSATANIDVAAAVAALQSKIDGDA